MRINRLLFMHKNRGNPLLNDQGLLDYSGEHLFYEILMFFYTAKVIGSPGQLNAATNNALVESFAIHLRNLIDFFYNKNPYPDDVVAQDFFNDNDNWEVACAPLSDLLSNSRDRANKEIGHLTTKRYTGVPLEKNWPAPELTQEIKSILIKFCNSASPDKLHHKVIEAIKKL